MENTYAGAGVNIKRAEAFVDRLKRSAKRAGHDKLWHGAGGYASIIPLSDSEAIALTTDGVGTKLLVACEQEKLDTIGIDLVAMCANDLICVGARPKAFLDYYATAKLDDSWADALIEGIIEGCDQAEMLLVGGETAEVPDLYQGRHFDLAGFAMGVVSKQTLLTGKSIGAGDVVVGIASSGIHSNGFSLARKLITQVDLRKELLVPTLIYVKPVTRLLNSPDVEIKGIVHITGGGWRNLFRLNDKVGYDIDNPLPEPEIFAELSKHVEPEEMFRTFNMGMGLAIVCKEEHHCQIIETFRSQNFGAQLVGRVTQQAKTLTVRRKSGRGESVINIQDQQ